MSRISIEVTSEEHQKLKTMAALHELEALLDDRIHSAKNGSVGRRTVGEIFKRAYREANLSTVGRDSVEP